MDIEDGGVYFNVFVNGIFFLVSGNEWGKGFYFMSGYYFIELCYLVAVYINLLVIK